MGIYLNPGNGQFQKMLRSKIYVDKSELIAYTNDIIDSDMGYVCVSRPRRFGKSTAANMLCAYYSKGIDSEALFQYQKIAQSPSFHEHLNKHNVIMLNIQQFIRGAQTPENLVSFIEQRLLADVRERYSDFIKETETSLPDALTSIYMKSQDCSPGFIFIIDEWDCIFREMKNNGDVQKVYLDFLKDLIKDRVYVKLAYMTGILPIKKYGTHSALNIFEEFSMTDSKLLARYIGFTEDEVKKLCIEYQMDFDEARRWYDGYVFSDDLHVYNPKSIVDAMHNRKFKSYWTRTETYEALRIYIDMNFDGLKNAIITMVGGGRFPINPEKFQNDMTSFKSKDDVLTLLVHLGYLAYDEINQSVFIPNLEIIGEFRNAIDGSKGWERLTRALSDSKALLEATLNLDSQAVAQGISKVHTEHVSVLSYNDENSLSCVITLAYFFARKNYLLIREFPSGKGFADIVFLPIKSVESPAIIVELKWEQSVQGAISQIKDKQYVNALEDYYGDILLVGINYDKKSKSHHCIIEKYSL